MYRSNKSISCTISLLFLVALDVYAVDNLPKQPITIEADQAILDEQKRQSTYSGNVILIQGPNQFKADKLTIVGGRGSSSIEKILAEGNPIEFRQLGEGIKADITGQAQKVEYDAKEQILTLIKDAKLTQGANEFSGDQIVYDTVHQIVTAEAAETGKSRVKVIIQPQDVENKDAAPSPKK